MHRSSIIFTIALSAALWSFPLSSSTAQLIFSGFNIAQNYSPLRPTLSPYLNLARDDLSTGAGLPNYQALVRPALEQYKKNQQHRRELTQLKRQADESRKYFPRQNAGQGIRSTGHPTRHRNFLHFFPQFERLSN